MAEEITEDSLVEIMNESELVTDDCCIKVRLCPGVLVSLEEAADLSLSHCYAGHPHLDLDHQVARLPLVVQASADEGRPDARLPRLL